MGEAVGVAVGAALVEVFGAAVSEDRVLDVAAGVTFGVAVGEAEAVCASATRDCATTRQSETAKKR